MWLFFVSRLPQLANIYSTEFVVETADSRAGKRYRQVFRNNMQKKVRMFMFVAIVTRVFFVRYLIHK